VARARALYLAQDGLRAVVGEHEHAGAIQLGGDAHGGRDVVHMDALQEGPVVPAVQVVVFRSAAHEDHAACGACVVPKVFLA